MSDLVSKYSIPLTTVEVYENRLVIKKGIWPMQEQQLISFKNITGINKPALLNCLDITTTDGKKTRVIVGSGTAKLKAEIESRL